MVIVVRIKQSNTYEVPSGNSLVVQWLELRAFITGARFPSRIGELRSHKPHSAAKKERTYPMTNPVETSPLDKVSLSIPSLLPNLIRSLLSPTPISWPLVGGLTVPPPLEPSSTTGARRTSSIPFLHGYSCLQYPISSAPRCHPPLPFPPLYRSLCCVIDNTDFQFQGKPSPPVSRELTLNLFHPSESSNPPSAHCARLVYLSWNDIPMGLHMLSFKHLVWSLLRVHSSASPGACPNLLT